MIDTNLKGAWVVAQHAAKRMIHHAGGGSIVNIASILGLRVAGWVAPYAISKAGVVQMTKALALENDSLARMQKIGVKFVTDVDKSGFIKVATPFQDSQAKALGPHAVKILELVRAIQ